MEMTASTTIAAAAISTVRAEMPIACPEDLASRSARSGAARPQRAWSSCRRRQRLHEGADRVNLAVGLEAPVEQVGRHRPADRVGVHQRDQDGLAVPGGRADVGAHRGDGVAVLPPDVAAIGRQQVVVALDLEVLVVRRRDRASHRTDVVAEGGDLEVGLGDQREVVCRGRLADARRARSASWRGCRRPAARAPRRSSGRRCGGCRRWPERARRQRRWRSSRACR